MTKRECPVCRQEFSIDSCEDKCFSLGNFELSKEKGLISFDPVEKISMDDETCKTYLKGSTTTKNIRDFICTDFQSHEKVKSFLGFNGFPGTPLFCQRGPHRFGLVGIMLDDYSQVSDKRGGPNKRRGWMISKI